MKKSIIAVAVAALGVLGALHAALPVNATPACCDGGACCNGGACCVSGK